MRKKQIVLKVILSIFALGLILKLRDTKSVAQEYKSPSMPGLLELSNQLENQYEEINTALHSQVNGWSEIDRTSITRLIKTQNKLVTSWKKFCQSSTPKSEEFPENCDNSQFPELTNQVNDSLKVLDEEIKPLLKNHNQMILSIDRYKNLKLEDNPSSSNEIIKTLQGFLKKELRSEKSKENQDEKKQIDPIIANIQEESGVFLRGTQKGLKIVSTKESRNIENNLLEINKKNVASKNTVSEIDSIESANNSNILFLHRILLLLLLLIFLMIASLIYWYIKSFNLSKQHLISMKEIMISIKEMKTDLENIGYSNLHFQNLLQDNYYRLSNELKEFRYHDTVSLSNTSSKNAKNDLSEDSLAIQSLKNITKKLVDNYNTNLKENKIIVSPTQESIEQMRLGEKSPFILKQDKIGSYWIILAEKTPEDNYYLVPKAGLIINDRIYQTVEYIFTCKGYENRSSNSFTLVHPAEVKLLKNNEYELLKPGELRFDKI
ncbi:MAG: hypothetical protein AAGE84_09545 [Cyanobacteria bacterium P01_G01_bin.39]